MPGFEIIDNKEKKAIEEIFDNGGILFAHGFDNLRKNYHVREFEVLIKNKLLCKNALCVTSGTAAIKIALKAMGVKPGDEVITQAFNFIATIEAILDVGAKPIICNIDSTLNMDPNEIETLITNKTSVILPVHMLGVPADMNKIMKIAKKHKLKVLEDNCEAVGAKYNGKYLGTIGDAGALSFDFGKVITAGEGGMIITNNNYIDKYSREYHDHGHENNPTLPRGRDTKTIYGFNYRMTEMQAAVGKVQLKKLNYIIKENKKRYNQLKKIISHKFQLRKIPNLSEPIFDTFIIFIEEEKKKKEILNLLNAKGFGTKNLPDAIEWHCSAFWQHALPKKQINNSKKTKEILQKSVAIPIWLKKKIKDYDMIAKLINNI